MGNLRTQELKNLIFWKMLDKRPEVLLFKGAVWLSVGLIWFSK